MAAANKLHAERTKNTHDNDVRTSTAGEAAEEAAILAGLQLLTYLLWRYVVNRRWYTNRRRKFIPYPAFLVFPGLLIVGVAVFLTGLLGGAIHVLLAAQPERGNPGATCGGRVGASCGCLTLAWVAVTVAASYFLFAGFILVNFNRRYRLETWTPTRPSRKASR